MKKCTRCNLLSDDFPLCSTNKDGLYSWCRPCKNDYKRKRYEKNPQKSRRYYEANRANILAQQAAKRPNAQAVYDKAYEYKGGAFCVDCGYSDRRVLEFDHVPDRGVKKAGISVMVGSGTWTNRLQQELDKCDVVCANCHRLRTLQRRLEQGN